jgi:hypothetical protein
MGASSNYNADTYPASFPEKADQQPTVTMLTAILDFDFAEAFP